MALKWLNNKWYLMITNDPFFVFENIVFKIFDCWLFKNFVTEKLLHTYMVSANLLIGGSLHSMAYDSCVNLHNNHI